MPYDPNNPTSPWAASWINAAGTRTTGVMNPYGLQTDSTGAVIDPQLYNPSRLANSSVQNSGLYQPSDNGSNGYPTVGASQSTPASNPYPTIGPSGTASVTPSTGLPPQNPNINPVQDAATKPYQPATNPLAQTQNPYIAPTNTGYNNSSITGTPDSGQTYAQYAAGLNTTQPQANTAAPQQTNTAAPQNDPFQFIQGGLVTDQLNPNGQPVNPTQYATAQSAQQLASLLGGTLTGSELSGNGAAGRNVSQANIVLPNGFQVNAGLFGDLVNKYGIEAAKKIVQDNMSSFGQPAPTTPQALAESRPNNPNAGQNSGQTSQDFMSQILGLYALLQKLGIGTQRPSPLMPANSNPNYFSQFA